MPDLYSKAMREVMQRDMHQEIARNARLTQRIHALEQLIEDIVVLLDTYTLPDVEAADAWLHRARAALQGEDRKESE